MSGARGASKQYAPTPLPPLFASTQSKGDRDTGIRMGTNILDAQATMVQNHYREENQEVHGRHGAIAPGV